MSNRRGLIVEGQHDIIVYDALLRKMGYVPRIRQSRGNHRLIRKVSVFVEMLKDKGFSKIIALKDLDSRTMQDVEKECSGFPPDIPLCVATQTMEAWLLADEGALRQQFRNPKVRAINHPEDLDNPKSELRRIYQENQKKYIAKNALPKILNVISLQKIREKCPSFVVFEETLMK